MGAFPDENLMLAWRQIKRRKGKAGLRGVRGLCCVFTRALCRLMHQTIAAHFCQLHALPIVGAGLKPPPTGLKTCTLHPRKHIMLETPESPVTATEEHYWDRE